jgi:hypothetical protein
VLVILESYTILEDYTLRIYKTGIFALGYEGKYNELKQFFSLARKVDEKKITDES